MHCLVIGGGAAGLMAAGFAVRNGMQVTVLERNPRMARKVMITGKGRCNVTNNCTVEEFIANVPGNGSFLYSALSAFTPQDLMMLLEEQGVPLKTERGNRVFPCSDRAVDVVDALVRWSNGCHFRQGRATRLLIEDSVCCGAELESGEKIEAYAVAVCTGGCSYPLTGSTGDGYELARQAGHTVTPLRPSLVPLEVEESWCGDLQGLSLRNSAIKVHDTRIGKIIYEDFGEMLFTHFGISGPMALSLSAHLRHMEAGRYKISIDLKPALSEKQLDIRLTKELEEHKNSHFVNTLGALLPRKLIPVMVMLSGVAPDKACNAVTREERHRFLALLKAMPLTVKGFRPIEEAIVTSGGVSVKEIQPQTMESKRVAGLYFAGEVLDVDAYTGGFNLQIAFSTGAAAGRAMC